MAYNKDGKSDSPMKRRGGRRRKKVCVFCGKDNVIDYKDTNKLKRYISERGKILPRRITGNCAKTSESYHSSNQESTSRCFNAIRTGLIFDNRLPGFFPGSFFVYFRARQKLQEKMRVMLA